MIPVGPDAAVMVSKATMDGTCDGNKVPSEITSATLFVRSGDAWKAAYHGQTAVIDPKSAPAAAPAKKAEEKKDDDSAKLDSDDAAKKDGAKPANTVTDELTKSLLSLENTGWEAWRAKDTAKIEPMLANDVAFVDPMGMAHYGKAANLKAWADQKCEVKSVNLSDAAGSSISPTVAILTFKGTADGTCDGQKLGPVWGTAIYHKEGDAWKLVFHMESPA
jgi:ketosteroid isomerase-like protein